MGSIKESSYYPCNDNVEYPILFRREQYGFKVWMQWYGQSESCDLSGKQFLFPLDCDLSVFRGCPEDFEVVMVGPVKNWNHSGVDYLLQKFGNRNVRIVHFISSFHATGNGSIAPLTGILSFNNVVIDQNCGVIHPMDFYDSSVIADIMLEYLEKNN